MPTFSERKLKTSGRPRYSRKLSSNSSGVLQLFGSSKIQEALSGASIEGGADEARLHAGIVDDAGVVVARYRHVAGP